MRRKTRTKVNRVLKIIGIILGIIAIIIGIILAIRLNKMPNISYDDVLVGKNFFEEIVIDFNTKQVKRDNIETTLVEEFEISEEEEKLYLSSEEELSNFLNKSVFEISSDARNIYVKRQFSNKENNCTSK